MKVCPSCGHENTADARFCSQCATPLEQGAQAREERKVVTCLFCDLVGFTARAERMDPEDVRRLLQPYHARVRTELERFGGTVDQAKGKSQPVRVWTAVRARARVGVERVGGAELVGRERELSLLRETFARVTRERSPQLLTLVGVEVHRRCGDGVTTGEALITLDARPEAGEGMVSGDVVNTASRLQAAAGTGAILVDETTYRAADRVIEFEEIPIRISSSPSSASESLIVRAAPHSSLGVVLVRDGRTEHGTGNRQEQTRLRAVRDDPDRQVRTRLLAPRPFPPIRGRRDLLGAGRGGQGAGRDPRVGQPGASGREARSGGALRRSRCSGGRMDRAARICPRGRRGGGSDGRRARGEAFAAWRRFLEALADERPFVVVFEDLHWADDAMLEFVDYLAEWAGDVPLLVLALGERSEAHAVAQEGYDMATALGLGDLASRALTNRGLAKMNAFDLAGSVADLELSIELARSVNSPEEARARHNLGSVTWFSGDLSNATAHFTEAARVAERFGWLQFALASRSVLCGTLYPRGRWTEALALADELIGELDTIGATYFEYHPRTARGRMALARGDDEQALADIRRAVEIARAAGDRQALVPVLSQLAFVTAALGRIDDAMDAAHDLASLMGDLSPLNIHRAIDVAWVARRLQCVEPLRRLTSTAPESYVWRQVVVAILDEDYERAASILAAMGHVDEGYAKLRAGERCLEEGRQGDAVPRLTESIAFFRPLGASAYVREAEELLLRAASEIPA